MAKPKPFHLRLFESCRSKGDGVDPTLHLSTVNPKAPDIDFPPPSLLPRRTTVISASCGCRPSRRRHPTDAVAGGDYDDDCLPRSPGAYLWRKDERWHVGSAAEAIAGDGDGTPRQKIDIFPPVEAARARRRKEAELRRRRRREARKQRPRASTSSAESGWFSSDGDGGGGGGHFEAEETETLVSSTTESSDQAFRRRQSLEEGLPAVLRRLVGCGGLAAEEEEEEERERKVEESFAVVKESSDPRGDFRRSMAEMVVEKELYEAGELKQLLRCFLSLNARRHHPAILDAFADVWEALFPPTSGDKGAGALPKTLLAS